MRTLAQSWSDRLAELRAMCKANGDRLDAKLREGYRRAHEGAWWAEFCRAAEDGADICETVWRSANETGSKMRRAPK